jgi:4'-phosphopantetheinyl transferase
MQLTPPLHKDEIHIWLVNNTQIPKEQYADFLHILSEEEIERANRFVHEKHRNNYIIAHKALRILLANYSKQTAKELVFNKNKYGKLSLSKKINIHNIQFNMAHSHNLTVFAFTHDQSIGIDIEFMRNNVQIESISQRYFSLQENKNLSMLNTKEKSQAFFNIWARKEAFIKAIGLGLSYPLSKFEVDTRIISKNEAVAQIALSINDDYYEQQEWHLYSLQLEENYASALAIKGKEKKIMFFNWRP